MTTISVSLEMPIDLGSSVVASPSVQASLRAHPEARVVAKGESRDVGGAYQDFGATAILVLGTPALAAGVKGLFSVIRTAIVEAHTTRREKSRQDHEIDKLVLVLDAERNEIDLGESMDDLQARLDALEQAATDRLLE